MVCLSASEFNPTLILNIPEPLLAQGNCRKEYNMVYTFNNIITQPSKETIFTAESGGSGYFKYNQVHLVDANNHYVYKFETDSWYMRNEITKEDKYLGINAHPTLNLETVEVMDADYWETIQQDAVTVEA